MSDAKRQAALRKLLNGEAIPFVQLFADEGARRNAVMARDDPKTPPELKAELTRYLENPASAAALDHQSTLREAGKLLEGAERRADDATRNLKPYRGGRQGGAVSEGTKHVRTIVQRHGPTATAAKLWGEYGGRGPIKLMKRNTFDNQVSAARKFHGFTE